MLNLFNFPILISKQKIKRKYWFVDIPIPESPHDKHKIPVINLYTLYTPPVLGLSIYTPPVCIGGCLWVPEDMPIQFIYWLHDSLYTSYITVDVFLKLFKTPIYSIYEVWILLSWKC